MTCSLPSQAPGLRWWERLRLQLCTFGSECRWTWAGMMLGAVYYMMIHYCFLLLFRFLLHSILLVSTMSVVGYGYATYLIQQRLDTTTSSSMPTRQAKVIRTKTIPKTPHPQIPQKTFCWLEISNIEDEDGNGNTTAITTLDLAAVEEANCAGGVNAKPEDVDCEEEEDDGQDDKDWIHVPCVIAQEHGTTNDAGAITSTASRRIQKGDWLTVSLIEGDISRPVYLPHQRIVLKRMKYTILRSVMWMTGAFLGLYFVYQGVPVIFAGSQQLEDILNAFGDKFNDWLVNLFPEDWLDDDDSEEDDMDEPEKGCSIPWFVAAGYDALLLVQIAIPLAFVFYVRWKKNQLLEESPADSYHLLRGDEDEEEVTSKGGGGSSGGVASQANAASAEKV